MSKEVFLGGREIATVWYNARRITLDDMIAALKSAGTYTDKGYPLGEFHKKNIKIH